MHAFKFSLFIQSTINALESGLLKKLSKAKMADQIHIITTVLDSKWKLTKHDQYLNPRTKMQDNVNQKVW